MRPENPSDRNFFRPQLKLYDPCTRKNVSSSKILAHYAKDEHFPPQVPRSLLSAAPCDFTGCPHKLCDRLYFEFIKAMYGNIKNPRIIVLDY